MWSLLLMSDLNICARFQIWHLQCSWSNVEFTNGDFVSLIWWWLSGRWWRWFRWRRFRWNDMFDDAVTMWLDWITKSLLRAPYSLDFLAYLIKLQSSSPSAEPSAVINKIKVKIVLKTSANPLVTALVLISFGLTRRRRIVAVSILRTSANSLRNQKPNLITLIGSLQNRYADNFNVVVKQTSRLHFTMVSVESQSSSRITH